jgi:hypothetical protein
MPPLLVSELEGRHFGCGCGCDRGVFMFVDGGVVGRGWSVRVSTGGEEEEEKD